MYFITTNLQKAMMLGYIGEITCRPTLISDAIRRDLKLRMKPAFTYYYCGDRDERLSKMFGYEITDDEVYNNVPAE